MVDFLIVGQGIAGSVLALQLLKRGKRVLVINNKKINSASNVAAGIYNPITGRAMVKTWLADTLFPYCTSFYQEISQMLGVQFLHPMPIFRPFLTAQERSKWMERARTGSYDDFVERVVGSAYHQGNMVYPYGGIILKQSGYLDVKSFLRATRTHLEAQDAYVEANFVYDHIRLGSHVDYQHIKAHQIIFCEGSHVKNNPFFGPLPFCLVKGELLLVALQQPLRIIYNRCIFVLPQAENRALVGATYDRQDLSLTPTEKARQLLEKNLRSTFKLSYTICEQRTGIRPATFDRRPFIGLDPCYPQLGIFNGLGTKGVSLAPYLAKRFVEYLLLQKELPIEVQLGRSRLGKGTYVH
ncbi:MAG: FAD-binding oxidoreductase [Amoebophilaceae bacterium]|jgi:glycine/D-amino acid oxidase-like deaminating enzyme|nr:FAD-binding oxidoreductase [Amoebophilaceae bacterium]